MYDLKMNPTDEEIKAMIEEVDEDKSGEIEFIEFCTLMGKKLSEDELEEMGAFDRERFGVLWGEGIRTLDADVEESE